MFGLHMAALVVICTVVPPCAAELSKLRVKELKAVLARRGVDCPVSVFSATSMCLYFHLGVERALTRKVATTKPKAALSFQEMPSKSTGMHRKIRFCGACERD